MEALKLPDIWVPAGLILGFQVSLFSWRLAEEARVGSKGSIPWLTPADYLNLLGMVVFVCGTFLLPMMNILSAHSAAIFFGLGALLFVGYVVALAAHYQLFNVSQKRQFVWFPIQERVAIGVAVFVAVGYLLVAFTVPPPTGAGP